jgi:MFS family permease
MSMKVSIRVYYTVVAVFALGQGLTLGYSVVYMHDARHYALGLAGTIVAVTGAVGLFSAPVGGTLSDRFGPARMLTFGFGVQFFGVLIFAHTATPLLSALGLGLIGLGASIAWPAQYSLLTALTTEERRTRSYALQFTILNAGIGVGGIIGGLLIKLDQPSSFVFVYNLYAAMIVGATLLTGLTFHGPWTAPPHADHPIPPSYRRVFANRGFRSYMAFSMFLVVFSYGQFDAGWAAYATIYAHASPHVVGLSYAANTAVIVIAQLVAVRYVDRLPRSRALTYVALGWSASWVIAGVALVPGLPQVIVDIVLCTALGLFGLTETLYSPVGNALVNDLADDATRGRYNALSSSTWSLANLVGGPTAGLLLGLGTGLPWVGVLVAGTGLSSLLARRLRKVLPPEVEAPKISRAGAGDNPLTP